MYAFNGVSHCVVLTQYILRSHLICTAALGVMVVHSDGAYFAGEGSE